MGEDRTARCRMLQQLATLDPHPESVPVNLLVRAEGTPLADRPPEDPLELARTIATARILMPASIVRLSAGRMALSNEAQALCYLAGANSVFLGDKLLTTPEPGDRRGPPAVRSAGPAAPRGAARRRVGGPWTISNVASTAALPSWAPRDSVGRFARPPAST